MNSQIEIILEWADMVADSMPHTVGRDGDFAKQQLQKLIAIANSHPQESELQEATARADYHMALKFMFRENSLAIEHLDAAIVRVGKDSLIAKMAIHNRAILHRINDESYDAFEEWSTGILERVDDPSSIISFTDLAGLKRLRDEKKIVDGMLPKAKAIEDAIRGGVRRVHVMSYKSPEGILAEVFTNEGAGTLIVADVNALTPAEQQGGK